MSNIIRTIKDKKNPYVMINKSGLEDKRLSFRARGVLSYLLCKPDDWNIVMQELINASPDGEKAVNSAIKELVHYGYMHLETKREKGVIKEWTRTLYETPSQNPFHKEMEPELQKAVLENAVLLNNDFTNINIILKNNIAISCTALMTELKNILQEFNKGIFASLSFDLIQKQVLTFVVNDKIERNMITPSEPVCLILWGLLSKNRNAKKLWKGFVEKTTRQSLAKVMLSYIEEFKTLPSIEDIKEMENQLIPNQPAIVTRAILLARENKDIKTFVDIRPYVQKINEMDKLNRMKYQQENMEKNGKTFTTYQKPKAQSMRSIDEDLGNF